jgi:hypothetical protein
LVSLEHRDQFLGQVDVDEGPGEDNLGLGDEPVDEALHLGRQGVLQTPRSTASELLL